MIHPREGNTIAAAALGTLVLAAISATLLSFQLLVPEVKEYPDRQNAKRIKFYTMLEGKRSWEISSYDAEIPESVMREVESEFVKKYDLADE